MILLQFVKKFIYFSIILLCTSLASCCLTHPVKPVVLSAQQKQQQWSAHQQQLSQLTQWQVQGKLGIRTSEDAVSARLTWQQINDAFDIHLSGPLGQGAMQIKGNNSGVQLKTSDGNTFNAATPEMLLMQHVGWELPVSSLFTWILGLPLSSSADLQVIDVKLNDQGQLATLQQAGWQLEYAKYRQFDNYQLPTKLIMKNNNLKVTIIIKEWVL